MTPLKEEIAEMIFWANWKNTKPGKEEGTKCLEDESQKKSHPEADRARPDWGAPRIRRIICTNCKGKDKAKDDRESVEDVGEIVLESPFELPQLICGGQ